MSFFGHFCWPLPLPLIVSPPCCPLLFLPTKGFFARPTKFLWHTLFVTPHFFCWLDAGWLGLIPPCWKFKEGCATWEIEHHAPDPSAFVNCSFHVQTTQHQGAPPPTHQRKTHPQNYVPSKGTPQKYWRFVPKPTQAARDPCGGRGLLPDVWCKWLETQSS